MWRKGRGIEIDIKRERVLPVGRGFTYSGKKGKRN